VGTLAILALAAYLVATTPGPGPLAAAHASIPDGERMKGCVQCHADEGLAAGCLACHKEIATQVREDKGYHAYLLRGNPPHCKECHADHLGRDFDITPAMGEFDHPHVEFALAGKHEGLACEKCHDRPLGDRARTFLGATQECASCHENIHKEERFRECSGCHTQESFKGAAGFAHEKLPLVNGHRLACDKCHENERDYTSVRGKRCEECHATPHRVDWGRDCESCHARDATPWRDGGRTVDAALHVRTGFPLSAPHDRECAECHEGATFAVRFRDPPRPPSSCTACHEDVHKGQFPGKGCLECHTADRWKPAKIDHGSFPLRFAHAEVACDQCHKEGGFRGTARSCAGCHEDRHKGQFGKAACDTCHDEKAFKPSLYTVARHETFALKGAHRTVACDRCHAGGRFKESPRACAGCHEDKHKGQFGKTACDACHTEKSFLPSLYGISRHDTFALTGSHRAVACNACHADGRFKGTPRSCKGCHEDPHGGQFARQKECTACHAADSSTFRIRPFDHAKQAGYALEGAHAEAACDRCHVERKGVRVFRGVSTACSACHTDVHRGQFEDANCDRCHTSRDAWTAKGFDHSKTRFPLDRAHAAVACDRCHFTVQQPDGEGAVQYRPLPTECRSCHAFK
jgi:hypothetical protein